TFRHLLFRLQPKLLRLALGQLVCALLPCRDFGRGLARAFFARPRYTDGFMVRGSLLRQSWECEGEYKCQEDRESESRQPRIPLLPSAIRWRIEFQRKVDHTPQGRFTQ